MPPRITSPKDNRTVTEGSYLDLFCNATGKPAPNITWTRVLVSGKDSKVLFVGNPWIIISIRRNFTGTYRCAADNGIGITETHMLYVSVACKWKLYVFSLFVLKILFLYKQMERDSSTESKKLM